MICIAFAMMIAGCKKVDVEFSYSPAEPRAGQSVKFNNTSSAGEKWAWDFGDNATSVTKHPSHIFKKPGEYLVTLMVDSAKHNTYSRVVTVYDTVPTFVTSTDSICHYTNVVLTANVYNPFQYFLGYEWQLPEGCTLVSGTLSSRQITVYFTGYGQSYPVQLTITQNNQAHPTILRELYVHQTVAPAIIMQRTDHAVLRQHLINGYITNPVAGDEEDIQLLALTSDTVLTYNGVTFRASNMQDIFPAWQVERMQLDAIAQKWYITTAEGLLVANFDGQHVTAIDTQATGALYVDAARNLLYWASTEGLKSMPLIKSKNNQFATSPILYNSLSDIDRIVVNENLK